MHLSQIKVFPYTAALSTEMAMGMETFFDLERNERDVTIL